LSDSLRILRFFKLVTPVKSTLLRFPPHCGNIGDMKTLFTKIPKPVIVTCLIVAVSWISHLASSAIADVKTRIVALESRDYDLVKQVQVDTQSLRAEVKADIQTLRSEVKADIQTLRADVKTDIRAFHDDFVRFSDKQERILDAVKGHM